MGEIARTGLSGLAGLPAPTLRPRAVVGVPRRRPRLLALDLEDTRGRAAGVAEAVVGALAAAGLHTPEKRAFWPHLTLARMRGSSAGPGRAGPAPIGPAAPEARVSPPDLPCDRVTLYRSHLGPQGARYEALEAQLLARPA